MALLARAPGGVPYAPGRPCAPHATTTAFAAASWPRGPVAAVSAAAASRGGVSGGGDGAGAVPACSVPPTAGGRGPGISAADHDVWGADRRGTGLRNCAVATRPAAEDLTGFTLAGAGTGVAAGGPQRVGRHGLEITPAVSQAYEVRREPVGNRAAALVAPADDPAGDIDGRTTLAPRPPSVRTVAGAGTAVPAGPGVPSRGEARCPQGGPAAGVVQPRHRTTSPRVRSSVRRSMRKAMANAAVSRAAPTVKARW